MNENTHVRIGTKKKPRFNISVQACCERFIVDKWLLTYLCAFFHVVFPFFVLQTDIIHILVEHILARRRWFHPRHVCNLRIATVNLTECELNVKAVQSVKYARFGLSDRIHKPFSHPRGHVTDVIRMHMRLFSSSGRFWSHSHVISPPAGLPVQHMLLFNVWYMYIFIYLFLFFYSLWYFLYIIYLRLKKIEYKSLK